MSAWRSRCPTNRPANGWHLAIRGTTTAVTYQAVRDELTAVGLAVWKLPEQIVVWSGEFPRTPSGKVIRRALADETRWMGCSTDPGCPKTQASGSESGTGKPHRARRSVIGCRMA